MTHLVVDSDWVIPAAAWIQAHLTRAVAERGRASVALCGGSTPGPLYHELAGRLDWSRIDVFFGDERCVPPDHEDSNHRLVQEALIEHVPETRPTVNRMPGEHPDPDAAALEYARVLPERLDLAIQGIGADGHTASLFPGNSALDYHERRVVHVADAPKPPPDRLTLTLPVLEAARDTVVLARGEDKAGAVAAALESATDAKGCPAMVCRPGAWFLDPAAASALEGNG